MNIFVYSTHWKSKFPASYVSDSLTMRITRCNAPTIPQRSSVCCGRVRDMRCSALPDSAVLSGVVLSLSCIFMRDSERMALIEAYILSSLTSVLGLVRILSTQGERNPHENCLQN